MSKISLRDYNHEIEGLINSGKTDEAIAHSKYILRLFPKCVDTYRLLGKAYLEAQRYSEATDILTRILSVVPDDFVSQIGMSIIREDEGNLDAAIYHMERAFEVKPSNSAIQEELRRLYGRRDGITPPRVRLTRGALVRMYTRGELYPQAIAEIRASLAEDPKRVDLEVILAQIYMTLGRKAEAIEVCSRLVNKLPNCLEANRILAEILPGTSRAEDAETYRQRVISLDPYSANITSSTPTSGEVPDNTVLIDFLEYQPSLQGSQQPEWATSVGVNLQETEEAIPDWLVEKPAAQGPGLPETTPPPALQPEVAAPQAPPEQISAAGVSEPAQVESGEPSEHEALIPDWMKSAGWAEASKGPAKVSETPEPGAESVEEIAQAELPDWLKAIAPEQETQTTSVESEQEDLARLDQLLTSQPQEPILPEEVISPVEPAPAAPVEAVAQPEEAEPAVELPAWLGEQPGAQEPATTAQPAAEEVPDWLAGLSIPAEPAPAPAEAAPAEELPDWLKTFTPETPSEAAVEPISETSPDWFKDLQAETEPVAAEEAPVNEVAPKAEEPMPDWLQGLGEEIPATTEIAAAPVVPQAESLTAPFKAEMTPETAETPVSETPIQAEEPIPDWLQGLGEEIPTASEIAAAPIEPQAEKPVVPAEAAMTPETEEISAEILPEMAGIPAEVALPSEPEAKAEGITPEEPAAKTQPLPVKKPEPLIEEVPATEAVPEIAQELPMEPVAAQVAPDDGIDAALAWLESLAVQQGAGEETLSVPPEQRTETPPEWIRKEIETAQAAVVATPPEAEVEAPQEPEIQPVPQAEVEAPAPAAELIPTAEEIPQPVVAEEFAKPAEAAMPAVKAPLEEIGSKEAVIPAAEPSAPVAPKPEEMDLDTAFAWLESLAARQGAEPETLAVPTEEQPTEWVPSAAAVEETQPAPEITPEAEEPAFEPILPAEPIAETEVPETITPVIETPVAEIPAEAPVEEEPLPDWLKGLETPAAETPPAAPTAATGESVSIWLKNVQVPEETTEGLISEQSLEQAPEEPLPEWLQGIEAATAVPEEPMASEKEPAEELPEWLKEAEMPAPEKAAAPVEEGLPEWLQGLETAETAEPTVTPVEPVAEEFAPAFEFIELPQEETAEVIPPVEIPAEEVVAELPQEPLVEAAAEIPEEPPTEFQPAEEPVPVVEEMAISLEQPEIAQEVPAMPVEEISEKVPTSVPEEMPAEKAPEIAGVDNAQVLVEAQRNLDAGDLDQALPEFAKLIESKEFLEEIIRDLQNALYRRPVEVALYETLGDAYAQADRLQDALDTYTKAEELLVK